MHLDKITINRYIGTGILFLAFGIGCDKTNIFPCWLGFVLGIGLLIYGFIKNKIKNNEN